MKHFTHILSFDSIESTNDFVKEHSSELKNHTVVVAKSQTKGRGQFERTWESESGKNLLFTILIKDSIPSETVSHIAVLSIIETLKKYGIQASFKLPNDVMIQKMKLAGMLIETKYVNGVRDSLILGIGWNVNQLVFETPTATSMHLISGQGYEPEEILKTFLEVFEKNIF